MKKDGQAAKKNGKDKSSTKLLVRNVAFEATEKDLRQLFSPFGQVSVPIYLSEFSGSPNLGPVVVKFCSTLAKFVFSALLDQQKKIH